MKIDGVKLNWATECFQWQRLLNRRRIAFVKLFSRAEIYEGFVQPNNAGDWNRQAVIILSGERCGEIMPMAFWFCVADRLSRRAKLCSVRFATEDEMLKFCLYGFSAAYRFQTKTIQTRSGRNVLALREIEQIDIPNPIEWHPVELCSQMAEFNDKRKELMLCSLQEETDACLQKSLGMKEAKDPLTMEVQWQFENHAHHVTGMRWDHARDFSPRSNLVEAWVKSGIYEVHPLEDLLADTNESRDPHFAPRRDRILLPRSIARYGIDPALSLISGLDRVSSRGINVSLCKKIDWCYAVYYLYSRIARLYLEGVSGAGRLQDGDFRLIPIALPPLGEQESVAAAIDDIVRLRRNREQEVERLKDNIANQVQKELHYE